MIKALTKYLRGLIRRKEGQGLVEYSFLILLVAIALMVALGSLGTQLANFFRSLPL